MKLSKHKEQLQEMERVLPMALNTELFMQTHAYCGLFTKAGIELRVSIARHKRAIQRKKRLIRKLEEKQNG